MKNIVSIIQLRHVPSHTLTYDKLLFILEHFRFFSFFHFAFSQFRKAAWAERLNCSKPDADTREESWVLSWNELWTFSTSSRTIWSWLSSIVFHGENAASSLTERAQNTPTESKTNWAERNSIYHKKEAHIKLHEKSKTNVICLQGDCFVTICEFTDFSAHFHLFRATKTSSCDDSSLVTLSEKSTNLWWMQLEAQWNIPLNWVN